MKNAKKPHSYIFVRCHICQVGKSKSDTFFGDFQLYNSTISTVGSCTVVAYKYRVFKPFLLPGFQYQSVLLVVVVSIAFNACITEHLDHCFS